MAVKFYPTESKEKDSLFKKIATVVDWFYALKKLVENSSRPCIDTCRCDQIKDLSVKIRCVGAILMDWSVQTGVSETDVGMIDQHFHKFTTSLNKHVSVKISCDEPSLTSLRLAKAEKPINVVFEAVESIVKFIKELLCVPACAFGRCHVKLHRNEQQQRLKGRVVFRTKPANVEEPKTISMIGNARKSASETKCATSCKSSSAVNCKPVAESKPVSDGEPVYSDGVKASAYRETKRDRSYEEKNKIVKESVQKIIELLEKKRKWVKPDGLHQFVLWREAYKGAKVILTKRKSRSLRARKFNSLSTKIGNFTRFTCGKLGVSFCTAFQ